MMRWLLVLAIVVCFGISLTIQANVPADLASAVPFPPNTGAAMREARAAGEIVREMTYGPGEDVRQLRFDRDVESRLVEQGLGGDPERVDELTDEMLRRSGAHTLNIVAWISVVALIAMLFGKRKAKPNDPPDAAE